MAEDMDLTWTIYEAGKKVRFLPAALSYPIEPHNFGFMSTQLRRWSHGSSRAFACIGVRCSGSAICGPSSPLPFGMRSWLLLPTWSLFRSWPLRLIR
jgi:cellulose synthase/poly-beta-1,6-N-acetylglucosamine synthase-like glycosyltransferase